MRFLMIAICCIVSCAISAHVDNDKPISVAMLPAKAQAVITRHFSHQKVVLAKKESGYGKSYDVVLRNGTKLEFDKRGNLTEIDCKHGSVPAELIPYPIRSYLRLHYPGKSVKKLEMGKKEYEVELANGMEFTFNKHFQLIDID